MTGANCDIYRLPSTEILSLFRWVGHGWWVMMDKSVVYGQHDVWQCMFKLYHQTDCKLLGRMTGQPNKLSSS